MSSTVNKIRGYRVMIGITQNEMAEKLSMSLRSYQLKESGEQSFKSDELLKIQEVLNEKNVKVSIDELLNA